MTTLIAAYNGDRCIGRCDAKCHNAIGPVCTCICGGKNHGVGSQKAAENVQQPTQEDREQWATWMKDHVTKEPSFIQLPLYDLAFPLA